jgi:hypothetical protein
MNRNANLKPSPKLTPVWAAPIWQKGGVLGRNPFLKFLNSWGDYGDQRNLQKITQETRTLHLNYMNYLIKIGLRGPHSKKHKFHFHNI